MGAYPEPISCGRLRHINAADSQRVSPGNASLPAAGAGSITRRALGGRARVVLWSSHSPKDVGGARSIFCLCGAQMGQVSWPFHFDWFARLAVQQALSSGLLSLGVTGARSSDWRKKNLAGLRRCFIQRGWGSSASAGASLFDWRE